MVQLDKYPGYFLDIIEDSKCLYGYEIEVYSSWVGGFLYILQRSIIMPQDICWLRE